MTAVHAPARIDVDFEFTEQESTGLHDSLLAITTNPYRFYDAFLEQVRRLAVTTAVPERFRRFVAGLADRDRVERPVVWIRNAPVDRDVPPFDFDEPVISKYQVKKTFVAEGFLALYAVLCGTPGIGYINVNDGDVFQDIYPKRELATSQSQKALREIHFHKDLANHFVRPDHVYMLGMRSNPVNKVYTTFVRNCDLLDAFTPDELAALREPTFYTPFDDLTVYGGNRELGDADLHPILSGEQDVRYFENRTVGRTPEAQRLLDKLRETLHRVKIPVFISPGDFVCVFNNYAVHAKEIVEIGDEEALKQRWIIKTVNVDRLADHAAHLVPGTTHLING